MVSGSCPVCVCVCVRTRPRNVFLMEAGTADLDLSTDAGTIGRASGKRGTGRTLSLDLKGGASLA